jgi:glycosyltransferase involved in cell wall biosynthesis
MDGNSVEVSVVIPSLNEEKTIGICIEKVKKVLRSII